MKEILQTNPKIIINTDIDGILSGLILHEYLGCEVVGFSNSDEKVWIDTSKVSSIYDAVYIDMYVPRDDVITIDQHIICVNQEHYEKLKLNPNKMNPNLERPRYFLPNCSYYLKYPFGTVHYICAVLASEGIDIDFCLSLIEDDITLGELILRADDAMTTTIKSNYMANAKSWWEWLRKRSGNSRCIDKFIYYLDRTDPMDAYPVKNKISRFLQGSRFQCSSPDGGYKEIMVNGRIRPKLIDYINYMARRLRIQPFEIPTNLTPFVGQARRISMNPTYTRELIDSQKIAGKDIFSYGFVRSSNRDANFSFTVMPE